MIDSIIGFVRGLFKRFLNEDFWVTVIAVIVALWVFYAFLKQILVK